MGKRWIKDLNIYVTKEDTQVAKRPMSRCLAARDYRGPVIKTAMRYHDSRIKILKD